MYACAMFRGARCNDGCCVVLTWVVIAPTYAVCRMLLGVSE